MRISDWSSDVGSSDLLNEELSVRNILNYSFLEHTYRFDHDGSRAEWTDWVTPDDGRVADVGVLSEEIQLQGRYRNGLLAFTTGLYFEQQRPRGPERSEEHTSELQSLMRISYAVFCL